MDLDPRNVSFASRRYQRLNVRFVRADATTLPAALGTFDVVASSNVFEHLIDVPPALDGVIARLSPDGLFLLAVPAIVDAPSLATQEAIRYHRSNLYVSEWLALLRARFAQVRTFLHEPPPGIPLDFSDPFPSRVDAESFVFREVPTEGYPSEWTLTAVFVCSTAA